MFREQIEPLLSELRALKAEKDGLETIAQHQGSAPSSDRKRRKGSSTDSDVSLCYLGVATKVLSKLLVCCGQDTSVLCPFADPPHHSWLSCRGVVTDFGVPTLGFSVATFPGNSVRSTDKCYTPSLKNDFEFQKHIVLRDVEDPA